MTVKIIGDPLPNIPWEDKPAGTRGVVWRSKRNPIIPRDLLPISNSIFNSAVVPYKGAFAGVFRCDDTARNMQLHVGRSQDGVTWTLNPERIHFACNDADCDCAEVNRWVYGYDPRVVWIEDRYYVSWCNWFHGPTIGLISASSTNPKSGESNMLAFWHRWLSLPCSSSASSVSSSKSPSP